MLWPGVSGFQAISGYTSVNTPAASALVTHTKGGKTHRTVCQHSIIPHKIIFLSLQILFHWRTFPRLWLSPTLRHHCEKAGCACPVLCELGKPLWLHAGALSWEAEDGALDSAAGHPFWVGNSGHSRETPGVTKATCAGLLHWAAAQDWAGPTDGSLMADHSCLSSQAKSHCPSFPAHNCTCCCHT